MRVVVYCLVSLFALLSCSVKEDVEVKNVIFLIADGSSLAHNTMLMLEHGGSAIEMMDNVALMTTHSANNRVTDSAAAGTAMATGSKTINSRVGMLNDSVIYESFIERAIRDGKSTGLISTCNILHATPAAFYANVEHRRDMGAIQKQLLTSDIDVLIGGGAKYMSLLTADGNSYWDAFEKKGYKIAEDLAGVSDISDGRLLCMTAPSHLDKIDVRGDFLPNATTKALEVLSNNSSKNGAGFVLMVEGGLVDFAAHDHNSEWLLDELADFDKTVAIAMDFADKNPGTLVVVTSDHETGGMTIVSGDSDFTKADSGVEYKYSTGGHSGVMVPIYLYGCGAERINGVMDNTELSHKISEILGQK